MAFNDFSPKEIKQYLQTSLFDDFGGLSDDMSYDELYETINSIEETLRAVKKKQLERERLEKEKRKREAERVRKEKEAVHVKKVTSMELPLDWENAFDGDVKTAGVHTESISDALIMSLTTLGEVDIEYISSVTGRDCKTVINALKGSIFQNPFRWNECFYKGWETADEYLSGNLMQKWKVAKAADEKYNGYFAENVKAIEKLLPPTVATKDIYITLGSPWVPPDIIDDFIVYLFGIPDFYDDVNMLKTVYEEITGTWEIPYKNRYNNSWNSTRVDSAFGTRRINGMHIIEKTLNMRSIVVRDKIKDYNSKSGEKSVINKDETLLAIAKQKKIIEEFKSWVWKDEKRKKRLEDIFEEKFSCVRTRNFDGSFLKFPNMSQDVTLYPYQKNAVARILFSPNTLLAHDVGSGKTYIMIAAGMELRRMGISKKNVFVVPNNLTGQWVEIFKKLYPDANVLCVEPKSFTPSKREDILADIRDNDYDGIIIAYSCFEMIPLSKDYYEEEINRRLDVIHEVAESQKKTTSALRRKQKKLNEALKELCKAMADLENVVFFDQLGITGLFVDEAHNFKNVPLESSIGRVLGLNRKGSPKCQDMMDKVCCVQRQNNGRGVVFATGTPITNSVTDVFVMQKYLQSGELAMLDLHNFDSWIGMFAEQTTEFEIDVDTSSYRLATRFARFHNLPELTALLSSVADFHKADKEAGLPEFDGYRDALVTRTDELQDYLSDISERADAVRSGIVDRATDNLLKITTDGRKAALDIRLVESNTQFSYNSKVYRCAENVFEIYNTTRAAKSTQLIFCDTSTPKTSFNIYDELKRLLTDMGVPENEIAYIHNFDTYKKRNALFPDVNNGKIRVLIGSTFKLGLGVNVQERLIAVHHLDVPWRPADMTQREGRILRQGNTNEKVQIFRYITEGSFDAYSWQLLETKQRFISELLSGSLKDRSGSDVDDTVLNYAEVKALAVGNPLLKQRVETANTLSHYISLQRKTVQERERLEKELLEYPAKIENQRICIENCKQDLDYLKEADSDYSKNERKSIRERLYGALENNVLKKRETVFARYRGFDIILPSNMTDEKPFVWLSASGRYYVELGDTKSGYLVRIDNCLNNLSEYMTKLENGLSDLIEKEKSVKEELRKKESYSSQIENLREQLRKLDEELGVTDK